ncbi:MAG TPA: hypothetical protein VGD31_03230, partial [Sphingobacteriaceae bacterium]
ISRFWRAIFIADSIFGEVVRLWLTGLMCRKARRKLACGKTTGHKQPKNFHAEGGAQNQSGRHSFRVQKIHAHHTCGCTTG